jgi:hypothetical protein
MLPLDLQFVLNQQVACGGSLNIKNAFAPWKDRDIPLEFVYDATDWRVWGTKEMLTDVRELWKAMEKRVWGYSVEGSK